MTDSPSRIYRVVFAAAITTTLGAQATTATDPDALYRQRADVSRAMRAADLWAQHAATDRDAAWKLARACYWLGTHLETQKRRGALQRGVDAGESAIRLGNDRPEGHFWLAANMGELAESFGIIQGLKYRGRIKDELERVVAIDPAWQGGSADAALGQWYAAVPRLLGGSAQEAEAHLRRALTFDRYNLSALSFLGKMLVAQGRMAEGRDLLQQVIDAPDDAEWEPEDHEFKQQSAALLKALAR